MRAWLLAACLVACWRDAPAPRAPESAADPAGPPPESRLVRPDPPAPMDQFSEVLAEFQDFADQMCQCGNSTCAYAVIDQLSKWYERLSRDPDFRALKPTEDQSKQQDAIAQRLGTCMNKARSSGSGTTMPTP